MKTSTVDEQIPIQCLEILKGLLKRTFQAAFLKMSEEVNACRHR